jgi:hypothetical protein
VLQAAYTCAACAAIYAGMQFTEMSLNSTKVTCCVFVVKDAAAAVYAMQTAAPLTDSFALVRLLCC